MGKQISVEVEMWPGSFYGCTRMHHRTSWRKIKSILRDAKKRNLKVVIRRQNSFILTNEWRVNTYGN